ncbi:hypothetical protein SIID45300_03002 [Candidatus Magnetaquicoccaceae bacterium FCR-1]|uniref:UspA domain-containing protein n=1 Tax=Candidatus Magnetaquiglobus chichijimensis TaxID=3141448 RepID=A0ABQ0CCM7_9PROT
MEGFPRILVVLDPNADPDRLIRTAVQIGNRHARAQLFFVSHLDPARAPRRSQTDEGDGAASEEAACTALRSKLDALGCDCPSTRIATAHSPHEVLPLAWAWRATLILSDPASAREVRQGWFPWLHAPIPLPCPLLVVQSETTPPLLPWRGWLHRLRQMWPSRDVAPLGPSTGH